MGIASVTAISCSHMLHYIKLFLWGAPIRLMLSLISHMSTVALWSATRVAMPKVPGSNLGRTNSIFDKLNLKSFPSWWKLKIGGKLVTHDRDKSGRTWPWLRRGEGERREMTQSCKMNIIQHFKNVPRLLRPIWPHDIAVTDAIPISKF
jgi:hypothetical protein